MSLQTAIAVAAITGDHLTPKIINSTRYKHWVSIDDMRRCEYCEDNHGEIWLISEEPYPKPPIHPNDRCVIEIMKSIVAGTATIDGMSGADWTLKHKGKLPDHYAKKLQFSQKGWKRGLSPSVFLPGMIMSKGSYRNDDGHLPQIPGRVWYEADINYKSGKRNSQRVLWSNDGLVFVTYDHYETFYEIV